MSLRIYHISQVFEAKASIAVLLKCLKTKSSDKRFSRFKDKNSLVFRVLLRSLGLIIITLCCFVFLILSKNVLASDPEKMENSPDNKKYTFGLIPSLGYDSDIGLKYGVVVNVFDFGKTKSPPHFDQYLYMKLTNTTKGTLNLQSILESESIIRKAKVIAEASYIRDRKLDFFGFNGIDAFYNKEFTAPGNSEFRNEFYYAHKRSFIRMRFDVQKYLKGDELRLLTGFTYNFFDVSPAYEEYSEDATEIISASSNQPTLYENYNNWGIIQPNESDGGNIGLLSLGLIYDSRNNPCYSTKGKWFEFIILHSPDLLSDESFTKLITTYRQHNSFFNDNLTLSFRVSGQHRIFGDIPFYFVPTFYDSRLSYDGVGGAYNLRGAMRNRIASDGFITGNFEIKTNVINLTILKQYFSAYIVGFYDNAYVTQLHKVNTENVPSGEMEVNFNVEKQKVNHTFGTGVYIVFNHNNIITLNYGIPINKQLGSGGLYFGSTLLF